MTALLGILLASLAGSVHCSGMCGPFVCLYAGLGNGPSNRWLHVAYNGGRLLSYLMLGALAGALGAGADRLGVLVGISRAAALLAGALMILWGMNTILTARGVTLPWRRLTRTLRSPLGGLLGQLGRQPPLVRAGATGLLTTLLPCGWLYAFVAAAAGSGNALSGIATMGMFWLGTLPALTALGAVTQRLAGRYGPRIPVAMASVVVLLGVLTIAGRVGLMPSLALPVAHVSHAR
ncbi:MAG: sulfite exporter TauE/SafE family protein [Gemmatimonadaceae bacterium]